MVDELIIKQALNILKNNGVIAYPTETLYGLGASIYSEKALEKLLEIKQVKDPKPISVLVSSIKMLGDLIEEISANAQKLIDKFWPGPLTIIFNVKKSLPSYTTRLILAGTYKIGIRYSPNKIITKIVEELGHPITSTSANITGSPPAKNVEQLKKYFNNNLDLIVVAEKELDALPSTVVDVTGREIIILREGQIKKTEIYGS